MLVQFRNRWIPKIPLTATLAVLGIFSPNYFQIGHHVVLLHTLMITPSLFHSRFRCHHASLILRDYTENS